MSATVDSLLEEMDSIEERRRERTSDKWTEKENRKFIDCIKRQFPSKEYSTTDISQDIDWDLVSERTNRSFAKCRKHWFRSIRVKIINEQNDQQINGWNQLYDTSRLISILYESSYESEDQIDWDFLKEKFAKYSHCLKTTNSFEVISIFSSNRLISYNHLLRIWRNLKISVPRSDSKTFKEIIDWLHRNRTVDEIVLSDDEL